MNDDRIRRRVEEISRLLYQLRWSLDDHNQTCVVPARAFLVSNEIATTLCCRSLWGIPVIARDEFAPNKLRIDCEGSAWKIEKWVEGWAGDGGAAVDSASDG